MQNKFAFILFPIFIYPANVQSNEFLVSDITEVLNGYCLDSYQGKYQEFRDQKAFSHTHDNTGKSTCSWQYGAKKKETAVKKVMERCENKRIKKGIDVPCELIDVNSEIVIEKGTALDIVRPSYPRISENSYVQAHDEAMKRVEGRYCQKQFRKYLNLHTYKTFAATTSDEGFYGVCAYSSTLVPSDTEEQALAECNRDRLDNPYSKSFTPECKVIASNNVLVATREEFDLPPFELDIFSAAKRMHLETVKKLVEDGAELKTKNTKGHTPLIVAIRNRRIEIVEYLVGQGVDVNEPSKAGRLPLKFAILAKRNDEVIEFLKSKGAKEQ